MSHNKGFSVTDKSSIAVYKIKQSHAFGRNFTSHQNNQETSASTFDAIQPSDILLGSMAQNLGTSPNPSIWLGGSSSADAGGQGTIGYGYAELLSGALHASGATVFRMWSSAIDSGSMRLVDAGLMTLEQQQQNFLLLQNIAKYCRANGITISVEDNLTWTPLWTQSWVGAAQAAGLPIAFVESNDEGLLHTPDNPTALTALANLMMVDVKVIYAAFPGVQIGDIQPPVNNINQTAWTQQLSNWWSTFNSVASANGVQGFAHYIADVAWDGPSMSWLPVLEATNSAASAAGLKFGVFINGYYDDKNSALWVSQAKQHLAQLAADPKLNPDFLVVETWTNGFPHEAAPISSPDSISNLGAISSLLYPLYHNGSITAQSTVVASTTNPQIIVTTNVTRTIPGYSIQFNSIDVSNNATAAIFISDRSGILSATAAQGGQVIGNGTSSLVLVGTQSALNAELASLTVKEGAPGFDTIDIEVYTRIGMVAQTTIPVLSLQASQTGPIYKFTGSNSGDWTTGSAIVVNGKITLETVNWYQSAYDPVTGIYHDVQTFPVYSPLSIPGLIVQGANIQNPAAQGSQAQLYDATFGGIQNMKLTTSFYNFDVKSGIMIRQASKIAPDNTVFANGSIPNPFSIGGAIVTLYNTGTNPMWPRKADINLASITTITAGIPGAGGKTVEVIQTWKPGNPIYQTILIYSPTSGALWEKIDSNASNSAFVTGTRTVTQYNTGDNPNWNSNFGSAVRVSTTYQDLFVIKQAVYAPDGSVVEEFWPQGNEQWAYLFQMRNSAGQVTQDGYHWKDGNPFQYTTIIYKPETGQVYQRWDQPRGGGYTLTQYDTDGTRLFASFVQVVDSNNRMVDVRTTWDTGGAYTATHVHSDSSGNFSREIDDYTSSDVKVQISAPDGTVFISNTVPLSAFRGLESVPVHFIFSGASGQTLIGTAASDDFIIKPSGSSWTETVSAFEVSKDILALPYATFGGWSSIQQHIHSTPSGSMIDSLDGGAHVLLAGITPSQLTLNNFVTI